MKELASSLLEGDRDLLVHRSHSFAPDSASIADAIGCRVPAVAFGNTWLRDEFIRTEGALLRVDAADRAHFSVDWSLVGTTLTETSAIRVAFAQHLVSFHAFALVLATAVQQKTACHFLFFAH